MTNIKSDCLGEKRTSSAPNLEMSKWLETTPMNSIAQQAVPKGMGQRLNFLPHFTTSSILVVMISPKRILFPLQCASFPNINKA